MKTPLRILHNKIFTALAWLTVVIIVMFLAIVLSPILIRGSSAVFFDGTVEFRRMQIDLFERGDQVALDAELQQAYIARQKIYDIIDSFKKGILTDSLIGQAKDIYREFGRELRYHNLSDDEYARLRGIAKDLRDNFIDTCETTNKSEAQTLLDTIISQSENPELKDTKAQELFQLARDYQSSIAHLDLTRREQYLAALTEVSDALRELIGPRPDEEMPALTMQRYGMTRMDMARKKLHTIIWSQTWVEQKPGQPLVQKFIKRADSQFQGTDMENFFATLEQNFNLMLRPKSTLYWQYFIDDSTPGHYFGGVGPEILGTLTLTLLAMLFAVPLGIISAAYLVECARDTLIVRITRTCINTLAGVPSIVFGLFGLAFFVLFVLPFFGHESKPCILTASLTLALLTLPLIIRASEEAIRNVPRTYKEASLALGAGGFRTFVAVTLPAALPGILTGIILGLSRAAGETAPILFTGAVALGALPKSVFDCTRTLSYGCYDITTGDRLAMLVPHNQYGMVMTLILLVICLNIVAIVLRSRMSGKLRGL